MVKGILIDVDGTLVLSNDAHARSWVKTLSEFGYKVSLDMVRSYMGMGADQMLPRLIPTLAKKPKEIEEILSERKKLFLESYASQLKPTPGARALIKKIKALKIKYIIASSSSSEELEVLLKVAKVDDLIETVTSGSDVKESKPEPDIVKAALKKLDLNAREAIMLGDTPYDIIAASKCSVDIIALRCGGFSDKALIGAVAIHDDPKDLLTNIQTSPIICK